jgi:rhamnosyltransferase
MQPSTPRVRDRKRSRIDAGLLEDFTMSSSRPVDLSKVAVIIPTWNGERFFDRFPGPLMRQGIRPDQVLVIDSESSDSTVARAQSFGFRVHEIPRRQFNHGGTRALASTLVPWAEILVYTTPDAVMATSEALATLVRVFEDPAIGAAYGRQLPHFDADPFARHACAFNYSEYAATRTFESRKELGYKAVFFTDVFGAYRRTALNEVGGFPNRIMTAEEFYVAGKMLAKGWTTAYVPSATVRHSHNQTLMQIFSRYFDLGVMHDEESWIFETFGRPSGEGLRFIRSEISFLHREAAVLIPMMFARTLAKYAGFQIGQRHKLLPRALKKQIGGFKEYWLDRRVGI